MTNFESLVASLETEPPIPCKFKVGQKVMFKNDAGIVFGPYRVTGFDKEANRRFIYLDWDSYWFATSPENLTELN